jgi:Ca2+-binding RTX toxin-like protein
MAKDAAGNEATQTVTLAVNNLDEVAPVLDSSTTATAIDENSGAGQVVYDADAHDPALDGGPSNPVAYSLGGTDALAFSINAVNGDVTLTGNPNYEGKPSYSFDVTATDAAGNATTQTVTLAVNNLDEVAPVFDSGTTATATAIDENSGASQVVYDADAHDPALDGGPSDPVKYSLGGTDAALFSIDADSGEVTLTSNPNYEAKSSYSFDVTATDAAGNATTQTVTLAINNLDEVAPVFDSGTTAAAINENSGAGQVVYDANAHDPASDGGPSDPVAYSLGGTDALAFSINAVNGQVTLIGNPDYEVKPSYSFDVTATDAAGNATTQTVTLAINNVAEADPNDFDDLTATPSGSSPTNGDDVLVGTSGDDGSINLSGGKDVYYAGAGNDGVISGSNGSDTIYGQAGNDIINGNNDNDTIYGGSGDDNISGEGGLDALYGGSGSDTIVGGGDNDLIIGGYGADTLTGSGGVDTFKYLSTLDAGDVINGFDGLGGAGNQDYIDLDALFDGLGVASADRVGRVDLASTGTDVGGAFVNVRIDTDGVGGADLTVAKVYTTDVLSVGSEAPFNNHDIQVGTMP